jgi:DNA helicase-2/ATP-dependent DNA helicase PcrA
MRPLAASTGGDTVGWRVGDKAEHGKWGIGTVVSVKGEGEGTELDIAFPSPTGIKRLLAKFAPIKKV